MRIKKENFENKIVCGDASLILKKIPDNSVDLVITSPPYFGCREYGDSDGLGREPDPRDYVKHTAEILHKIWPVLKNTGSFYLNIGDIYFGTKGFSRNQGTRKRRTDSQYKDHKIASEDGKYLQHKQRLMLPERIAIELQNKGWILRNNIIWEKPNPLPCQANDRRQPVYENIFHFVKQKKYYHDNIKAKAHGHHRDIVKCSVEAFKFHIATFPEKLILPLIEISCPENGVVLDPFLGGGTTAKVARDLNRKFIGVELNYDYCIHAKKRIQSSKGMFDTANVDIEIRKKAPKEIACSVCGLNKRINQQQYWNNFIEGGYEKETEYKRTYICKQCISISASS